MSILCLRLVLETVLLAELLRLVPADVLLNVLVSSSPITIHRTWTYVANSGSDSRSTYQRVKDVKNYIILGVCGWIGA